MKNIVLLGDSILDNRAYVAGMKAVEDQLTEILPSGSQVTLLAIDGSVTTQVTAQLDRLPSDAAFIVVSSGGNDALRTKFQIFEPDSGLEVMDVLQMLAQKAVQFRKDYSALMDSLQILKIPIVILTIYDKIPGLEETHRTALSVFNDIVIHEASKRGFAILDIRNVCTEKDDYSELSPIEPSAKGGMKIVEGISQVIEEHETIGPRSVVY